MSSSNIIQQSAAALIHGRRFAGDHELIVSQQPLLCKVFTGKEKDRKPIDPPPMVQLSVSPSKDPNQAFLQSPYYFCSCSLVNISDQSRPSLENNVVKNVLCGTLVSSPHRLKDIKNRDGAFFIFGDISVKIEGKFRLLFNLFEIKQGEAVHITNVLSDEFEVFAAKSFPGMLESTFTTRTFSDQGVRLRLRKEPRTRQNSQRQNSAEEYQQRQYESNNKRRRSPAGSEHEDDGMIKRQQTDFELPQHTTSWGGANNYAVQSTAYPARNLMETPTIQSYRGVGVSQGSVTPIYGRGDVDLFTPRRTGQSLSMMYPYDNSVTQPSQTHSVFYTSQSPQQQLQQQQQLPQPLPLPMHHQQHHHLQQPQQPQQQLQQQHQQPHMQHQNTLPHQQQMHPQQSLQLNPQQYQSQQHQPHDHQPQPQQQQQPQPQAQPGMQQQPAFGQPFPTEETDYQGVAKTNSLGMTYYEPGFPPRQNYF